MKRVLFAVAAATALTLGGASAALADHLPRSLAFSVDEDCDGYDDITGEPTHRADGVCGG